VYLIGLYYKKNRCTYIKYVLSHIINYQHLSIAKAIETCCQLKICDKMYFIHVHLLVLLYKFKYSFNAQMWNILSSCLYFLNPLYADHKYYFEGIRMWSGDTLYLWCNCCCVIFFIWLQ